MARRTAVDQESQSEPPPPVTASAARRAAASGADAGPESDLAAEPVVAVPPVLGEPVDAGPVVGESPAAEPVPAEGVPAEPIVAEAPNRVGGSVGYQPDRFLQGLVARACRDAQARGSAVHIQGPWPTISLFPRNGSAVVAGGAGGLVGFATQPDLAPQAELTFAPEPLFSPNHPGALGLDTLLWGLALLASRGRLPVGTPRDGLFLLRDWPNFTRLTSTPAAMSIAALWTQGPHTLADTVRLLDVPPEEVFTFFSAASALGLVAKVDRLPEQPRSVVLPPSPRRGLLRRVFDRLRPSASEQH